MSDCEHEHSVLCWKDTFGTDREYEMAFGYDANDGEPTVAISWEGCEHPISLPVCVMIGALMEGWEGMLGKALKKSGFSFGWPDEGGLPFPNGLPAISFLPGDPALN